MDETNALDMPLTNLIVGTWSEQAKLWGKLYNGYTADEWNDLSAEAREAVVSKFSDFADYINKKMDNRIITT